MQGSDAVAMSKPNKTPATWQRLAAIPGGKWAFSRLVCWKAPYFASIRPMFEVLRPGHCEVRMPKKRAVLNHIGTVHAIAMCNLAERAAGTMTDSTVPSTHRWIPKGMTVEYLRKAETGLRAVATLEIPAALAAPTSLPVVVNIMDSGNETVMRATINMWVSPRK